MKVPSFAEGLMYNLSATHVSIITKLVNYSMSSFQRNKYLNPLRDIIEYKDWIDNKIALGYYVSIVGKDVPKFISRIKDPIKYYSTNQHKERIKIWFAIVPKSENPIQNSIEIRNTTIGLQSVFLLPPIKFNVYSPEDYSIENNIVHFSNGYFNKYPNIIYKNNKVWFSHTPYNNNGIDVMFFMTTTYVANRKAIVYLSLCDNLSPNIVMFNKSSTQDKNSNDELCESVGTHYINIFSDSLSIGSSINNSFDNGCKNSIKLYVDSAYSEYVLYGIIDIPLDRSDSDFFNSTNMDPTTLYHT